MGDYMDYINLVNANTEEYKEDWNNVGKYACVVGGYWESDS